MPVRAPSSPQPPAEVPCRMALAQPAPGSGLELAPAVISRGSCPAAPLVPQPQHSCPALEAKQANAACWKWPSAAGGCWAAQGPQGCLSRAGAGQEQGRCTHCKGLLWEGPGHCRRLLPWCGAGGSAQKVQVQTLFAPGLGVSAAASPCPAPSAYLQHSAKASECQPGGVRQPSHNQP